MSYIEAAMRFLTIRLDDEDFALLRETAARRGDSVEASGAELLRSALREERRAGALAVLDRLDREQEPIGEEEAMRIAIEEVRAMRAERRAADRQ